MNDRRLKNSQKLFREKFVCICDIRSSERCFHKRIIGIYLQSDADCGANGDVMKRFNK